MKIKTLINFFKKEERKTYGMFDTNSLYHTYYCDTDELVEYEMNCKDQK